jgi:glycosyltransferase involved in cell wall biosynthesis
VVPKYSSLVTRAQRRILLGVTSDLSLVLLSGFPAYLVEQGWDVHVACTPGPNLEKLATHGNVHCHPLPMEREPAVLADLRALRRWLRLLALVRPDVVLVGTPKAGLLGLLAAWTTRVPTRIYQLRGLRLETTRGLARRVWSTLERVSFATSTEALAVSASLRRRVIELGLVRSVKVLVLGGGSSNGVDIVRFRPDDLGTEPRPHVDGLVEGVPVIGFVGRLNRDKGLDVLYRASTLLEDRGIAHQILIVGGVDGADQTHLFETAHRSVVVSHVGDTAPYYRLMQVLCLPTLREGFPNVVLEASASGLPVVTTDATGAIDSVQDGVTGLIAEAGSAESLADMLAQILHDPDRAAEMGRRGRDFAVEGYARDIVWSRLADHLDSRFRQARTRPASRRREGGR